MNEHLLIKLQKQSALALALGSLAVSVWDMRVAAGMLAGGAWNLASFWCLARLLRAWLGHAQPSKRRVVGWVLLKFPLLYIAVFGLLRLPCIAPLGFGLGFTLVLAVMLLGFVQSSNQFTVSRSHGP